MMKLKFVAPVLGAIMLITASTAWAAQGQITEVNPSGLSRMPVVIADFLRGLFAAIFQQFTTTG